MQKINFDATCMNIIQKLIQNKYCLKGKIQNYKTIRKKI